MRKSDRYMSWMRANKCHHEPSIEAVLAVYFNLYETSNRLSTDGNIIVAKRLDALAERLWSTIKEAILTSEPKRRTRPVSPIQHGDQLELPL